MLIAIAFALVLFSPQQSKPETVALVFGPDPVRIEIVRTEEAEARYENLKHDLLLTDHPTEEDLKMFAALTYALAATPTTRVDEWMLNPRR